MKMATLFTTALLALIFMTIGSPAYADIAFPTETTVRFQTEDGQPYAEPVNYTVTCYGYSWSPNKGFDYSKEPGSYTPKEVFSYSHDCSGYGCTTDEVFYLNYRHIDYCNIEGTTAGKYFKIENFSASPINFEACEEDYTALINRKCNNTYMLPELQDIDTVNFVQRTWYMTIWCWFIGLFGFECPA
ncbi:MAG: hypothetical protein ABIG66_05695 [Candidatus Kerfeldbacteria bacterium]